MSKIDDALAEAVESFVEQLKVLIQRAALESVQTALNGGHSSSQRGSKLAHGQALTTSQHYQTSAKRTPAELAALSKKLHSHIARHPGLRIEKIATDLGLPTKALVLPVKRLTSQKKLTTKGQKRATLYFAH
jgi:DNA-binding NtrC family response regulator